MAEEEKRIKKIKTSDGNDVVIDATYWGGHGTNNIKTINGQVIFGNTNGTGNVFTTYPKNNHGTTNSTASNPCSILPNVFHVWDTVTSLFINFITTDNSISNAHANEYIFQFISGSTPTTLSLPSGIKWANGTTPANLEAYTIYQISILENCGTILSFKTQ